MSLDNSAEVGVSKPLLLPVRDGQGGFVINLESALIGLLLGIVLAVPLTVAGALGYATSKQAERERQSLALALGCGPAAEIEIVTSRGVGVVKCKTSERRGGSGD